MSKKTEYLGFECEPELKERVRKAAQEDGRTLSSWMRRLLDRSLRVRERLDETDENHDLQTA